MDGGTQPRAAFNQATVDEYAEVLTAGGELPPVTVFHDGSDHWLVDGFHRLFAHRKIGALTLMADVRQGTLRDAVLWSVGANAAHGLRRTNEDKRKAVLTLLADAEWSKWSDRQIAEACAVGHPMVAALRRPEVAQRQQEARNRSAANKVESDSTPSLESDSTPSLESDSTAATPPEESSAGQAGGPDSTGDHAEPGSKPQEASASAPELAELREVLAEQTVMLEEAQDKIESLSKLVDASDQMAEARRQIHQLQAEVRVLRERQAGLMNEAAEAKRLARSWRLKLERIEKARV
ncbi:hypothetical protein FHP08_06600 [Zeimonas arvi]|uniref:ParB-like N-terminal domain-containing protein n=1 Tax=Zeimonas arvi TaxID=2498847 RepID=A0A5C8P1G2_9BURK|nr:hypothetical protein FHP08_06600 [Zeimonas arvi]